MSTHSESAERAMRELADATRIPADVRAQMDADRAKAERVPSDGILARIEELEGSVPEKPDTSLCAFCQRGEADHHNTAVDHAWEPSDDSDGFEDEREELRALKMQTHVAMIATLRMIAGARESYRLNHDEADLIYAAANELEARASAPRSEANQ